MTQNTNKYVIDGFEWRIKAQSDGLAIALNHIYSDNMIVVVPDKIENQTVVALLDRAFYKQKGIIEIKLPDSIKTLGEETFFECVNLKKINIPDQVNEISKWCFAYCSNLQEIEGIDHITYFNAYCFYKALCLEEIFLGDIDFIGYYAFSESLIKRISIGNIKTAGKFCFSRCCTLYEVVFNDSATAVPAYFLYNCINLQKVKMKNINVIGEYAFGKCERLLNIKIPASISKISTNILFENQMDTVIIPEELENVCLGVKTAKIISCPLVVITVDYCERKLGVKTVKKYFGEKIEPIPLEETSCRQMVEWYESTLFTDGNHYAGTIFKNWEDWLTRSYMNALPPFDFMKPIFSNITLFAKWEVKQDVRESLYKAEKLCD